MVKTLKFSDEWLIKKGWGFSFYDVEGIFYHNGVMKFDDEDLSIIFENIEYCIDDENGTHCKNVDVIIYLDKSEISEEDIKDVKYAEDVFNLVWESWEIFDRERNEWIYANEEE